MLFRLTTEKTWSREFQATTAEELIGGVREAWDAWIRAGWPDQESAARVLRQAPGAEAAAATHPGLAHRVVDGAIHRWLAERLARADGDKRSWRAQADLWSFHARSLLGEADPAPLVLHVRGETAPPEWLDLRVGAGALPAEERAGFTARVPRRLSRMAAERLYTAARAIVEHDRNLAALAGHVGEAVRRELYPAPRLVSR